MNQTESLIRIDVEEELQRIIAQLAAANRFV